MTSDRSRGCVTRHQKRTSLSPRRAFGSKQIGVQASDEHTLIVELEAAGPGIWQLMAATDTFPVPRHLVATCGERWRYPKTIATNGPLLQTWQPGEKLVMVRNPHFHWSDHGQR